MIRAIIIDDEPLAIEFVKEQLEKHKDVEVVAECLNGFEGAKAISQLKPDLIFLDIQMPKITGFEMLELMEDPPAVIFITAFDEYAVKAFEKHAVDYLLKPVDPARFEKAINKFRLDHGKSQKNSTEEMIAQSFNEKINRIVVKDGSNIRILPLEEVIYFEGYDDYVKINTRDNCYLKKLTLSRLEDLLNEKDFTRIHRSYIIRLAEITRLENSGKDNHEVILRTGTRIPVSRTGYPRLKSALGL